MNFFFFWVQGFSCDDVICDNSSHHNSHLFICLFAEKLIESIDKVLVVK